MITAPLASATPTSAGSSCRPASLMTATTAGRSAPRSPPFSPAALTRPRRKSPPKAAPPRPQGQCGSDAARDPQPQARGGGRGCGYEKLSVAPTPLDHNELAKAGPDVGGLERAARASWRDALTLGEAHGYRNAQVSVIAPTGTIGLVMDCDTTGIEPDSRWSSSRSSRAAAISRSSTAPARGPAALV